MYPSQTPTARRALYNKVRNTALKLVGLVCKGCGHKDRRVLQIDHVKNDGAKERKRYKGISYYYHIIREVLSGKKQKYQALCANCNFLKRLKNQN